MTLSSIDRDIVLLDRAARRGLRGHGLVEPNPMVGCIAVDGDGHVIAESHHRRLGGPHAERLAIEEAGERLRGGTLYVTLEPCTHTGRTGPCSEAIIEAGPGRIVIGCKDPNPEAAGGIEVLRAAGIEVELLEHAPSQRLAAPFIHRVRTGRPWIVAKWAQTLDGKLATRSGHSQWISGEQSRRLVHRVRGRVDAILTGIGTVTSDDPRLTARSVRRRRTARRVVIDPVLRMPLDSAIMKTLDEAPLTIACSDSAFKQQSDTVSAMTAAGVDILPLPLPAASAGLPLLPLLDHLSAVHNCATMLVEAGPGLLSSLMQQGLLNEAIVFVSPRLLGDREAFPILDGFTPGSIQDGMPLELQGMHRRGDDVVLRYGVGAGNP